nr:cytochrome b [Linognathus africanus]
MGLVKFLNMMTLVSKGMFSLPTPSSISYMWNMGVLLGSCLGFQLLSGVFLSFHYSASMDLAFSSVIGLMNDVNWGWLIRVCHANVASLFFMLIYIHIGRGLYYGSYSLKGVWMSGVLILLILMGTAFVGYVLPWGQMSFWGATVITNLLSAIPYVGHDIVFTIWGGFSVSGPTLTRMFSFHFLMPFVLIVLVMGHIMSLHHTGSSNPLGLGDDTDKIPFGPYFIVKDLVSVALVWSLLFSVAFLYPEMLMDPDNFIKANPLSTPPHIQPEWYFLFAYSILRSIPNKLGGVVALLMSIIILLFLPSNSSSSMFNPLMKVMTMMQAVNFCLLTWLGAMPVEDPYTTLGKMISLSYFGLFLLWGVNNHKTLL